MPFLSKHPGKEILEQLIIQYQANLFLISDHLLENQGTKATMSEIAKWINADEGLRKLAVEARQNRQIISPLELKQSIKEQQGNIAKIARCLSQEQGKRVWPTTILRLIGQDEELVKLVKETRQGLPRLRNRLGKGELKSLIKEHEGYQSRIRKALEAQGIKVWLTSLSRRINRDKELRELIIEMRQARKAKQVRKRVIRRGPKSSERPENEELKQLIIEHKGYALRIIKALAVRGIKVSPNTLSRRIKQDKELKELIGKVRQVREKEDAREQVINQAKQVALQDEKIPLSEEEIEVLSAYQEGDSIAVLASKLKQPGGRVDSLITSILFKKHVATLGEAKVLQVV